MSPLITMVVPYYRQPQMLIEQVSEWADEYDDTTAEAFRFIIVDDCSPEPAEPHVREWCGMWEAVSLYRIDQDVPWNRGMARNLGTKMVTTPWVLHVDTDHVLPAASAEGLVTAVRRMNGDLPKWFRFTRRRIGAADETRKKDAVAMNATNIRIHPHIDSYLTTPEAYWKAGGYNEDFSGVLGGGTPFLKEMERVNGPPGIINDELHVHTRHSVPDSSEHTLPRSPEAFKKRKQEIMAKRGTLRGHDPIRLPWHRVF